MSAKLMPAASTRITTRPSGGGSGMSRRASASGPPKCVMTMAFMARRRADCITGSRQSSVDRDQPSGYRNRRDFAYSCALESGWKRGLRSVRHGTENENKKTGAVLPRDLRRFLKAPEDIARMLETRYRRPGELEPYNLVPPVALAF